MAELKKFMQTDLYKEIKVSVGLPPTNKLPNDNFNLIQALRQREHGLASPGLGSFSVNQHRGIANLYIPNKKKSCLMSFGSQIIICKFDKAGDQLLTACQEGIVRFYDSSKGIYKLKNRVQAGDRLWSVIDANFSPCGQFFCYSTWNKSLVVLPVNGSEVDSVRINLKTNYETFAIFCLSYSPCGRKVIGGSIRSAIYIADIERKTAQYIGTSSYPAVDDINAISYVSDRDPNVIVCGCEHGCIRLYDLRCDLKYEVVKPMSFFFGHDSGVTYLDSRNDGNHILSNSKDQTIKIWDLRKPSPITNYQNVESDLYYHWVMVPQNCCNPRTNLENDNSIMTYRGHRVHKMLRAKFSPAQQTGQRYIYTGCASGHVFIYDVLTGDIKQVIKGHTRLIHDLDWHPKRPEIVTGSWDSNIHLNTYQVSGINSSSLYRRERLLMSTRLALSHETDDETQVLPQDKDGLTFTSSTSQQHD